MELLLFRDQVVGKVARGVVSWGQSLSMDRRTSGCVHLLVYSPFLPLVIPTLLLLGDPESLWQVCAFQDSSVGRRKRRVGRRLNDLSCKLRIGVEDLSVT